MRSYIKANIKVSRWVSKGANKDKRGNKLQLCQPQKEFQKCKRNRENKVSYVQ